MALLSQVMVTQPPLALLPQRTETHISKMAHLSQAAVRVRPVPTATPMAPPSQVEQVLAPLSQTAGAKAQRTPTVEPTRGIAHQSLPRIVRASLATLITTLMALLAHEERTMAPLSQTMEIQVALLSQIMETAMKLATRSAFGTV
jgi:hypothetical protein